MFSLRVASAALALAVGVAPPTATAHPEIEVVRDALEKEAAARADDPAFALTQARAHRIAGDFDAALESIAHAEAHGGSTDTLGLERAQVFLAAGWLKTAQRHVDRVLATHSDHAHARFMRARVLVKQGRPAAAAPDYARALTRMTRPKPEHFIEYRDAALEAGDRETALAALSLGVERLGPIVSLQLPAIDLALELGRPSDALARIDSLLAQNPNNELWLARRGDVLMRAGRPEEANASYATALSLLEQRPAHRRSERAKRLAREIRTKTEENR